MTSYFSIVVHFLVEPLPSSHKPFAGITRKESPTCRFPVWIHIEDLVSYTTSAVVSHNTLKPYTWALRVLYSSKRFILPVKRWVSPVASPVKPFDNDILSLANQRMVRRRVSRALASRWGTGAGGAIGFTGGTGTGAGGTGFTGEVLN